MRLPAQMIREPYGEHIKNDGHASKQVFVDPVLGKRKKVETKNRSCGKLFHGVAWRQNTVVPTGYEPVPAKGP